MFEFTKKIAIDGVLCVALKRGYSAQNAKQHGNSTRIREIREHFDLLPGSITWNMEERSRESIAPITWIRRKAGYQQENIHELSITSPCPCGLYSQCSNR